MSDDIKILSAIKALHERFVEEPTEQKVKHLWEFLYGFGTVAGGFVLGNDFYVYLPTSQKMHRYIIAAQQAKDAKFSPKSIAHLNEVAEETLG